ncbi:MAG: hypothetical protein JXX29_15550 [Deltaproteobacteria bacterium]|nr:hypothetical protein [Deltaproteobacteria bacterium]MBN2673095.1 hypothetical protein [Deltaproteobacteria bacterium]
MSRSIYWLCIFVLVFVAACTVVKQDDFEYEVDPSIGKGSTYPTDDESDTVTDTDSSTDTDTDTATDTDTGTDSSTE